MLLECLLSSLPWEKLSCQSSPVCLWWSKGLCLDPSLSCIANAMILNSDVAIPSEDRVLGDSPPITHTLDSKDGSPSLPQLIPLLSHLDMPSGVGLSQQILTEQENYASHYATCHKQIHWIDFFCMRTLVNKDSLRMLCRILRPFPSSIVRNAVIDC